MNNLMLFVDGHFDPTERPGGNGCIFPNLWDFQMYNPLHKGHWIMYQGVILVNCVALCFSPYAGNDNNAKTLIWAGIIQALLLLQTAEEFSHTLQIQHTLLEGTCTGRLFRSTLREGRWHSLQGVSMCSWSTFWCTLRISLLRQTIFAALQHKQNKKVGRQDMSKIFSCAVFFAEHQDSMLWKPNCLCLCMDGLFGHLTQRFY